MCLPSQGDEPAPEDEEEYEADEAEDDSEGSDEGESDGGNEVSHVLTVATGLVLCMLTK